MSKSANFSMSVGLGSRAINMEKGSLQFDRDSFHIDKIMT